MKYAIIIFIGIIFSGDSINRDTIKDSTIVTKMQIYMQHKEMNRDIDSIKVELSELLRTLDSINKIKK
jgi:hypothetical protein